MVVWPHFCLSCGEAMFLEVRGCVKVKFAVFCERLSAFSVGRKMSEVSSPSPGPECRGEAGRVKGLL